MGTWEDTDDAWLRALTRERRAEAKARRLAALPDPLRYSVQGDEFTPSFSCVQATARSKSRAKTWRREQWRDGRRACEYCGVWTLRAGRHVTSTHPLLATTDHKHPLALGGDDAPWNYALACLTCNGRKADMTEAEFRALLARERACVAA